MRAQKLQASESLGQIERQLADARLKLGQQQMEMQQLRQDAQTKNIDTEERRLLNEELQSSLLRLKQTEDRLMLVMNEKKELEEQRLDLVDKKAVEEAKGRELKMRAEIGHLRTELNFLREKLKIVENALEDASGQNAEAGDQGAEQQKGSTQRIFQQLMKSLERAKKTFVLLSQRQSTLENSRLCPGC